MTEFRTGIRPPDSRDSNIRGSSNWQRALTLCLVATALLLLFKPGGEPGAPANDFAFYWTAARLVIEARNPYSPQDAVDLQNRLAFAGKGRLVMLNPPWVLPLIVPFGLLSFSTGKSLWFVVGVAAIFVSIHWLWDLYGEGRNRWIGWLVAVTFLPTAVVLAIGQIGPLILLGLAGYLRFQARQRDYLAGAFLFLTALKPHLVLLLWIALLLYALYERRWKPLAALLAALASASLMAALLDHRAFQQYVGLFGRESVAFQESPTLGGLLRHISGLPFLQFLPLGVAVVWFVVYWIRWRSSWDWPRRLPSLLLVSIVATSYAWLFDQVVLLPSLFCATVLLMRSPRRVWIGAVVAYGAINCLILLFLLAHRPAFYYSWTALAWLVLAAVVQQTGARRTAAQGRPSESR
jgi:hypothetical protein